MPGRVLTPKSVSGLRCIFIWGVTAQAAAWAALNGIGLALVMPCVQAILAEVYYARQRGRAFGLLFTISALGGMFFNFIAVTFGDREINGLAVSSPFCGRPFI